MENTINFETAERLVVGTWKKMLRANNPYLIPILLPLLEHAKPLFKEFYDLGIEHTKAQAVPEWISTEEAMPKAGTIFLGRYNYGCLIDQVEVCEADGKEDPGTVFFSHWMPYPTLKGASQ